MSDTRILPDLQCSLLCEDIRQENNGNPMLFGILTKVVVQQLPVTAHKIFCFNRWTAGVGEFTEQVKIIAPDGATTICENKTKYKLASPDASQTNVHLFQNVTLKDPGAYQIEVNVDEVLKLRYPLPVLLVNPQDQAHNPGSDSPKSNED